MKKLEYQVIEDNGGGLHVFVWADGKMKAGMYNFEYLSHEDFAGTLAYLESSEADIAEIGSWDSQYQHPQEAHDGLTASNFGWQSIAEYKTGQLTTYPERMGRAGIIAFGLEDE